jgi:hypothetical protein
MELSDFDIFSDFDVTAELDIRVWRVACRELSPRTATFAKLQRADRSGFGLERLGSWDRGER